MYYVVHNEVFPPFFVWWTLKFKKESLETFVFVLFQSIKQLNSKFANFWVFESCWT